MFIDTAKVFIKAGDGGNGAVSFRREIYVDKGGPDGGNGGRGGNVVFRATKDLNTLLKFRYNPEIKAKNGGNGAKRNAYGKSGEDLIVEVPVGTVVKNDKDEVVADLVFDGDEAIIAKGGEGGFGNSHFKSSVRQAPRIAERGMPGEEYTAELELKLLADVGLVGFPNAGKSTFLSVVSNARPEIADYEFTTLTPNLGVATIDDNDLLIADIPGLIEGASDGKGLGDKFLRHVERTSVLLHLIDAYAEDIGKKYLDIRRELESYSSDLAKREEVIAITKIEGLDEEIINHQMAKVLEVAGNDKSIFAISALSKQNLNDLLRELQSKVSVARENLATQGEGNFVHEVEDGAEPAYDADLPVIKLAAKSKNDSWRVEKVNENTFVVFGEKFERFALKTDFGNFHSSNRLRDIFRKHGIENEIRKQGGTDDSEIQIAGQKFLLGDE